MPVTPSLILPANLLALGAWVLLATPPASAAPVKNVNVVAVADDANISLIQQNSRSQTLQVGQTIKSGDKIEVPPKSGGRNPWALLKASQPSLQAKIVGLSKRTTWLLPCTFSGAGFISWSDDNKEGCAPPGW